MIEFGIVFGFLVVLALLAAIFYLSHRLVRTNQSLLASNESVMRHALAINADAREFERIRFNADNAPQRPMPTVPLDTRPSIPAIDGMIPVGENGQMDYAAFERGGGGG